MPRYSLRALLILMAIGPPLLAGAWWGVCIPRQADIHTQRPLHDLENREWPKELRIAEQIAARRALIPVALV